MTLFVESLESRKLLAADLSLAVRASSIPAVVVEGVRAKRGVVSLEVANIGDESTARSARTGVRVILTSSDGFERVLIQRQVAVGNLVAGNGARRRSVVSVQLPTGLAVGSYQLRADVNSDGLIPEASTENNSVLIGQVTVEAVREDVAVSASLNLSGQVMPGTAGRVRVQLSNAGNVPIRAVGRVELVATSEGRSVTLAVVPSVRASLRAATGNARAGVFSVTPVSVLIPAFSSPGGDVSPVEVRARFLSSGSLRADLPENNQAVGGTLAVLPGAASVLAVFGFGERLALSGGVLSRDASGAAVERGRFVDRGYGRVGVYELRLGGAVEGNGGQRVRSGPLVLRDGAGQVTLSVQVTLREGVLRRGRLGLGAGRVMVLGGDFERADGEVLVGGVVVGVSISNG